MNHNENSFGVEIEETFTRGHVSEFNSRNANISHSFGLHTTPMNFNNGAIREAYFAFDNI